MKPVLRGPRHVRITAGVALGLTLVGRLAAGCGSPGGGSSSVGHEAGASEAAAEGGESLSGVVNFTQSPDGGGTFFASFGGRHGALPAGCVAVDAGACTTVSCPPPPDAGSGDASVDATVVAEDNPGVLEVSGGTFRSGFALAAERFGTYFYASPVHVYAPGDVLGVSGSGATLPAFPKRTVTAPPTIQLTEPTSDGGRIAVVTSVPLQVSWTGGAAGDATVLVATALFTSGAVASVTCTWDASLGTGTVPSTSLTPLAAHNAVGGGMSWYQLAQTKFDVGPSAVTMSAYSPQGSLASFQ